MPKLKIAIIVSLTLSLIVGAAFFLFNYFKPKLSGVSVNSSPVSSIYINGVFVGKTPYTGTYQAEQINLKLVPDSAPDILYPYETKINLVPGVKTIINREFAETEDLSSGGIISFEKASGRFAGLTIVSVPDVSQVLIDGASVGVTPYNFGSITTGSHKLVIKSEGYVERELNINTIEGLKLTVFAKLAKDNSKTLLESSPSPAPQEIKGYVIIGNTPTGFLRMRTEPDTKGEEIAELKSGEKYAYLETDSKTGWYKIRYKDPAPGLPDGITGWVSNQYSELSTPSTTVSN